MSYTYTTNCNPNNITISNGGTVSGSTIIGGLTGSTITLNSGAGSGGFGGAGQIYTTTASGSTTWANPISEVMKINQTNPPTIEVKGNMVINGVDLEERLKTIEQVLTIPERDVILEKKHPKLKKLYDEYIHALAKYRTFEAIKGEDDVT